MDYFLLVNYKMLCLCCSILSVIYCMLLDYCNGINVKGIKDL